jgi:ribosomal protein S12 methylthiotransferase
MVHFLPDAPDRNDVVKIYLASLGCPKNLVDSQGMVRLLQHLGHRPVDDPSRAQVLIVNTCGFIHDAQEESLGELRRLARRKRRGQVLIAAGCLAELWGEELRRRVPGIDALLGTRRWAEIDQVVGKLEAAGHGRPARGVALLGDSSPPGGGEEQAAFARQGATAYLKIADGCSAPCAFCAIPLIKGPAVSRPAEAVVADAAALVEQGVQEIILIAQNSTAYGRDRGEPDALPDLVQSILGATPGLRWLRLMYAYPGHVSPRTIEVLAGDPRVCHYLDLPLQHAHPEVLRRMRRPAAVDRTLRLIDDLRAAMPDLALRTSLIAGYPGETEAEFEALLEFVRRVRFDRAGVFVYSAEAGTAAAALPDAVPEEIAIERRDRLMAVQQDISLELNRAQVGRRLEVLIEGQGDGLTVGRSYRDAPEIDGLVLLSGAIPPAPVGQMVTAEITDAMEYDLVGRVTSS